MLRHRLIKLAVALGAAVGLLATTAAPASAIGYYNLPGSFCQCFGYGNGAGHHACLVLGPASCAGFCATHEVRLEHPPQPPYGYYGCCANGQCGAMSRGTWLEGPEPSLAPAAMRPQILR
jgi:hypothetical protein